MNRKYPRAQWHDYNSGVYFVTVCTHHRIHYFGKICNNEIIHTEIGAYLCRAIEESGIHYPKTTIDRYVVMPNHLHAIITVVPVGSRHATAPDMVINMAQNVGCLRPPCHPQEDDDFQSRNHFNALLSQVIGGIKSAVTRHAHLLKQEFRWQANFHDHIIQNQNEYDMIADYIDNNITNWNKDKFYT